MPLPLSLRRFLNTLNNSLRRWCHLCVMQRFVCKRVMGSLALIRHGSSAAQHLCSLFTASLRAHSRRGCQNLAEHPSVGGAAWNIAALSYNNTVVDLVNCLSRLSFSGSAVFGNSTFVLVKQTSRFRSTTKTNARWYCVIFHFSMFLDHKFPLNKNEMNISFR